MIKMFVAKILNLPKWLINRIVIIGEGVKVGKENVIYGIIKIKNKGQITIGNHCMIMCSPRSNKTGQEMRLSLITGRREAIIEIGNHVHMSNCNINALDKIVIEDHVMIGGGVKIWDSDFHSINYEDRWAQPDLNIAMKPVRIKQGVFLGGGELCFKGSYDWGTKCNWSRLCCHKRRTAKRSMGW